MGHLYIVKVYVLGRFIGYVDVHETTREVSSSPISRSRVKCSKRSRAFRVTEVKPAWWKGEALVIIHLGFATHFLCQVTCLFVPI